LGLRAGPGPERTEGRRDVTPLTAEYRAAREAEHEAGRHADPAFVATTDRYIVGNAYVVGCPLCEAEDDALEAELDAEEALRAKAERKAEREAALLRAAWLRDNPDAIAWRCTECSAEFTDDAAGDGQGALYECGDCGPFSRGTSADGDSNRCPQCGHFGSKLADLACPECNEGELEPIGPE
jgi:DNA-directed RNA polymerase subunit RPC12/RpoP